MKKLHVVRIILGAIRTNCYLAVNSETKECFIVDPAENAGEIIGKIKELDTKPVGILLTHGHYDHTRAAEELKNEYKIPILALREEQEVLGNASINLSVNTGAPFTVQVDTCLQDKEEISLAGFCIQVWHTPGHTQGGACYYLSEEDVLFSGDTLFLESVGRTDLPTGSAGELLTSVRGLLDQLPGHTRVYPGHESETDIAHEKKYNPFL